MATGMIDTFKSDTLEVTTSSGRTFKLRQLSALDQISADSVPPGTWSSNAYFRIALAITHVDDKEIVPASSVIEIRARAMALSGSEIEELAIKYGAKFAPSLSELKNELTPEA